MENSKIFFIYILLAPLVVFNARIVNGDEFLTNDGYYEADNNDDQASVEELIRKLRDSLESPGKYLQKRGNPDVSNVQDEEPPKEELPEPITVPPPEVTVSTKNPNELSFFGKIKQFFKNIGAKKNNSNELNESITDLQSFLQAYELDRLDRSSDSTNITTNSTKPQDLYVDDNQDDDDEPENDNENNLSICTEFLKSFSKDDLEHLKQFVDCWRGGDPVEHDDDEKIRKINNSTELIQENTNSQHMNSTLLNRTLCVFEDKSDLGSSKNSSLLRTPKSGKGRYRQPNMGNIQGLIDRARSTLADMKSSLHPNTPGHKRSVDEPDHFESALHDEAKSSAKSYYDELYAINVDDNEKRKREISEAARELNIVNIRDEDDSGMRSGVRKTSRTKAKSRMDHDDIESDGAELRGGMKKKTKYRYKNKGKSQKGRDELENDDAELRKKSKERYQNKEKFRRDPVEFESDSTQLVKGARARLATHQQFEDDGAELNDEYLTDYIDTDLINEDGDSRSDDKKKRGIDDISRKINEAVAVVQQKLTDSDEYERKGSRDRSHSHKSEDYGDEYEERVREHPAIKAPKLKEISNSFEDDLKMLSPQMTADQSDDIDQFIRNLNSPPQVFTFDVDKFVKKSNKLTSNFIQTVGAGEERTERTFYEFPAPPERQDQHDPNQLIVFDDVKTNKRDILEQRIKAISNSIRMKSDESVNETPIEETNAKDLNEARQDPDDFVEHYYLLNDGKVNLDDSINKNVDKIEAVDPVSFDIDLDLNKKFQDLKFERDKEFYSEFKQKSNR